MRNHVIQKDRDKTHDQRSGTTFGNYYFDNS